MNQWQLKLNMEFKSTYIPYRQTGSFSKIVTDYLDNNALLRPFYNYEVNIAGIKKAIAARKIFKTNRSLLVSELEKLYATKPSAKVKANIELLLNEETFTICTAHQPNIFTGHLYFIYKIIHAIKLADDLKKEIPACNFVPVYYMGSEDADLEELGEVVINEKKYQWQTKQKGAVGRMRIDKDFIKLIEEIQAQLSVEKYGDEIISQVKTAYTPDKTIEQATFEFVNSLFADYGLIIFLPDNPAFKNEFNTINTKEITEQFSHKLVEETIAAFPTEYKVQAAGRELNLFYLKDDIRERIYQEADQFKVNDTAITFSETEILAELKDHPDRFSQNVILRPLFQELILPNIAFIGGGGELSYWLELKKVFAAAAVPFPVLILRNSFTVINKNTVAKLAKLKLTGIDFFKPEKTLIEEYVKRESSLSLDLAEEKKLLSSLYHTIKIVSAAVDHTLSDHVEALETQAVKRISILEKKMLKAEKIKFDAGQRQIHNIKEIIYPSGTLQERIDNLLPYYAIFGKDFIEILYKNSKGLEQQFCILEEITSS